MSDQTAPINVAVFLYPGVEELDFVGPFETFQAAGHQIAGRAESATHVFTVAETLEPIRTAGGIRVIPDHAISDHPAVDILVVPGGNSGPPASDPTVTNWVAAVAGSAQLTTSVCTGAYVLGEAGLLTGRRATTHWMSLDQLATTYPDLTVERNVRWVDDGNIVTAAGVSAGIDMALHVVSRVFGSEVAENTAAYMEYRWDPSPSR